MAVVSVHQHLQATLIGLSYHLDPKTFPSFINVSPISSSPHHSFVLEYGYNSIYGDSTWASRRLRSSANRLFVRQISPTDYEAEAVVLLWLMRRLDYMWLNQINRMSSVDITRNVNIFYELWCNICQRLPSGLWYNTHQIPTLKRFS